MTALDVIPPARLIDVTVPPSEEWRSVVGYEGLYWISNLGRIQSRKYLLRPQLNKKYGRYHIWLVKNRKGNTFFIHKLVANAFLGPCPDGFTVNHIDTNKLNNVATNLEYLTDQDNKHHALRNGITTRKFTSEQVEQIKRLCLTAPQWDVANKFECSQQTISRIVRGQRYNVVASNGEII